MGDDDITRLLAKDFSAGTEAFRDNLLDLCLAELSQSSSQTMVFADGQELDDDDLEMLAAAGPGSFMVGTDGQDFLGF